MKGPLTDGHDGGWDRDLGKAGATIEGPLADGRDGGQDRDLGQAAAVREEGPLADGRNRGRDRDLGRAQAWKAASLIDMTEDGIETSARLLQPKNA